MNQPPIRPTIQALELEAGEEIKLYLELIRIIEKDIDEINAGDTRNGWTSWAVIGGIAWAIWLLLAETRKLQALPAEEVKNLSLILLLFHTIIMLGFRIFSVGVSKTKPGRIRWSNDVMLPYLPAGFYRTIVFIAAGIIAVGLTIPTVIKGMAVITFSYLGLVMLLVLVVSVRNSPVGRPNLKNKWGSGILISTLLLSLLTFILLSLHMQWPVGEAATLPYILAGLIVIAVLLIESFINLMAPSRLLSNLQDLRNDVIFLRIDIDEALRRYETLTEGETLPDALQKELSDVLSALDFMEYVQNNMATLISRMTQELPKTGDPPEQRAQKQQQLGLYGDSYSLHKAKYDEVGNVLKDKLQKLNKKMAEVRTASEDVVSEDNLRTSLLQRLKSLQEKEVYLNQNIQAIQYYAANPDKIPPGLSIAVDGGSSEAESSNGSIDAKDRPQ